MSFKSGFISITGKANVGKSTLLNTILGQKISIVSPRPNLTRKKILGIKNLPDAQLIFIDTPGIHRTRGLLNRLLVKEAIDAGKDADIILFMVEAHMPVGSDDLYAIEAIRDVKVPIILAYNKIDLMKSDSLPDYQSIFPFTDSVVISASSVWGIPFLLEKLVAHLPEGPKYFPEDMVTDELERSLAGEIIREKIFEATEEEVPYACAVVVEEFSPREGKDLTFVSASIYVERDSQKGIIIGRGGRCLKKVGELARADIEALIGQKVFLELWVKVAKNWRKDPAALKRFGFVKKG